MKQNSFWGTARSRGLSAGLIVRLSLAIVALVGSITLAWTLLNGHTGAHAAGANVTGTLAKPWSIVFDSAGNAWVAEPNCDPAPTCGASANGAIEEFSLNGGGQPTLLHQYAAPGSGTFHPTFLQLDGAGHVWFTDPTDNAIGEVTTTGNTWQEFTTGITANAQPFGLVRDKTGNLWFAERSVAGTGRIGFFNTSSHAVVEKAVANPLSQPYGMAYNATTNTVWFTEDNAPKIGSFVATTTGTGITITEVTSNSSTGAPNPHLITLDSLGNLWYSEQGSDLVGEYNPTTKVVTQFSVGGGMCATPPCSNTFIDGIGVDSAGLVWFNESQGALLGSLNPTTKVVNLFPLPSGSGPGDGLAVDSHKNVWVTMKYSGQIGELPFGSAPTPTPSVTTSPTTTTPTPTGTPSTLQPGPVSKIWYFAEGRVGGGFNEYLSMDNPTGNTCAVNITYLYTPDRGTPQTKTVAVTILPNTRYEEGVPGDLGTSPSSLGITNSAIVAVDTTATPACAGIVAERPMYFNALGTNSGSDVLGVTKLAQTFYIGDVATNSQPGGGSVSSFITILNPPNGQTAHVTATYYASGASVGTDTVTVPGGTRGTIFPDNHNIPSILPAHVSVVVTSDQPVAVERPEYFSNINGGNAGTVSGGADVIAVQSLATDWLFAEGYTGGQFQENLVIANLDTTVTTPATVTIKLEPQNGTAATSYTVSVPQFSQVIWNVNAVAPGQSLSAEVTSSGPKIVVEREMFFHYLHNANGRSLATIGGSDALGQTGPAAMTNYSFAEGYVNVGFDEWLTIQNPTATAEVIWITLYNAVGTTYTTSISVAGQARATVDITGLVLRSLYHTGDGFRGLEVAMTVQTTSTQGGPFVAERPMYITVGSIQAGTDIIGYTGG